MDHHTLILLLLAFATFLGMISAVNYFSQKTTFPYTVALLILGFVTQIITHALPIHLDFSLSPDIIYFILLPILLFEAALHINLHQFRLQFKTITFFAVIGLLIAVFSVAGILTLLIGLPFEIALLFGALISATDPIAVLALFKSLGAPKRLGLIADGESMFNDATAVIAFRIISGFVVAETTFGTNQLFTGLGDFLYIFFGSLILGGILGIITSLIVDKIKTNYLLVSTITVGLGIGSFVGAEHFFHLSGVITTVAAGLVLGNLGRTKLERSIKHSIEQLWEFLGFIALSLVFFFAAYSIDFRVFEQGLTNFIIVIGAVLVSRAISVYISAGLTNSLPFFKNEPNIPRSWQHVLTWGGLRGVIPLVLVYSLPDSFIWKQHLLAYTLVSLLFTVIVNGLTIKKLLFKLGLHLPKKEEEIIHEEEKLFALEEVEEVISHLDKDGFNPKVVSEILSEVRTQENELKSQIMDMATPHELQQSLEIEAINIERDTIDELYHLGYINEQVYYQFDTELDLQQDALEYPEVFTGRGFQAGGFIHSKDSFRSRLLRLNHYVQNYPFLKNTFQRSQMTTVENRYSLLRARVIGSNEVLKYLEKLQSFITNDQQSQIIADIEKQHREYIKTSSQEISTIEKNSPSIIESFQRRILVQMVSANPNTQAH